MIKNFIVFEIFKECYSDVIHEIDQRLHPIFPHPWARVWESLSSLGFDEWELTDSDSILFDWYARCILPPSILSNLSQLFIESETTLTLLWAEYRFLSKNYPFSKEFHFILISISLLYLFYCSIFKSPFFLKRYAHIVSMHNFIMLVSLKDHEFQISTPSLLESFDGSSDGP